jgi:hypothetical protein
MYDLFERQVIECSLGADCKHNNYRILYIIVIINAVTKCITFFMLSLCQASSTLVRLCAERVLMTLCGVSVLTLAAIAYDRHTALVWPLSYDSRVTPR